MPSSNSTVGTVNVEVSAETKKLTDGLKKAEQQSRQSASRIDQSFKKVGERFDKSTEGVRKFQGALSGTIGVVTGVTAAVASLGAAVKAVYDYFKDGATAAEKFVDALAGASAEAKFEQLQDRMIQLNAELERKLRLGILSSGRTKKQIEEEIEVTDRAFQSARKLRSIQAIRAKEQRQAAAEAAEEQARLDAIVAGKRKEYLAFEEFITKEKEKQARLEEEQARKREEANRREEQALQRRRQITQDILNLQRQINSTGITGSAGSAGAAINATRKGP